MKRLLQIAIVLVLAFGVHNLLHAQKGSRITTVVIDAGHGGKDPGALGKHSKEKNIALAVALKTGKYIEEYLPDVKVIYTRSTDRFVELYKRAAIANEANADFFISIHCNSNNDSRAYGSETYAMGLHKSNANLNVAMKENAAITFEEDAGNAYEGFDANSPESYIRFSLFQNIFLDQSLELANKIEKQFKDHVGRKSRGVHQAGFLVLWRTAMPGVLVELGFLSNPTEERFLLSDKGQVYMASAIYRAFKSYKLEFEKENKPVRLNEIVENGNLPGGTIENKGKLDYRIQFYTSPIQLVLSDPRFKNLPGLAYYLHNGVYKYTSGHFSTLERAIKHQKIVRDKGFTDAFVVPFTGKKRITLKQAGEIEAGE
ncbi:MAG: N-acetylmuramoyl-L-alanine amidase [Bacteroidales bacterium]|nr:N-acetylmuramoyl-L-alanine amidase [Bacteroidales bacterium]